MFYSSSCLFKEALPKNNVLEAYVGLTVSTIFSTSFTLDCKISQLSSACTSVYKIVAWISIHELVYVYIMTECQICCNS